MKFRSNFIRIPAPLWAAAAAQCGMVVGAVGNKLSPDSDTVALRRPKFLLAAFFSRQVYLTLLNKTGY